MIALLDNQAVLEAAHSCYALALADEFEELGGRIAPRTELHAWAPRLPNEKQLPIVYFYLGQISQAWGADVGLVFYHAGIEGADVENALRYLLLGCQGHGVSLADDFAEAIGKAEAVLGKTFKLSPIYFEGCEWRELASEAAAEMIDAQGASV